MFELLETVAENCTLAPTRGCEVAGLTVTTTPVADGFWVVPEGGWKDAAASGQE